MTIGGEREAGFVKRNSFSHLVDCFNIVGGVWGPGHSIKMLNMPRESKSLHVRVQRQLEDALPHAGGFGSTW